MIEILNIFNILCIKSMKNIKLTILFRLGKRNSKRSVIILISSVLYVLIVTYTYEMFFQIDYYKLT